MRSARDGATLLTHVYRNRVARSGERVGGLLPASQGNGLHQVRSLGPVNFWASALTCIAVVLMCVTGPLTWWRRPA